MSNGAEHTPGQETDPVIRSRVSSSVHPVLRYTTLRIGLFVVVLGVTYLIGLRGLSLLAAALLVSGGLSLLLLRNQRDVVAGVVETRVRRSGRSAAPSSESSLSDRRDD